MDYSAVPLDEFNTKQPVFFPLAGMECVQLKKRNHFQDRGNLHWPQWGDDCGPIRNRWTLDAFVTCYWLQCSDLRTHGHLAIDSTPHSGSDIERLNFLNERVENCLSFGEWNLKEHNFPNEPLTVDVIETRVPRGFYEIFEGRAGRIFFIAIRHPNAATRNRAIDSLTANSTKLDVLRRLWELHQ